MCNDTTRAPSYLLYLYGTHMNKQATHAANCLQRAYFGVTLLTPLLQSLYFAHMKTKYTMCPGTYGMMIMLPSQTLGISHLDQIILPCCLMLENRYFSLVLFL